MFGYVLANKSELKIREFEQYRAYYCGFCKILRENYGISGQMTLSYDLTFLIMLLTGLYEPSSTNGECRCIVHPVKKHKYIINEFTEYAADMNIVLTYYKEIDDWEDEKKISGRILSDIFKRKINKDFKKYENKIDKIHFYLKELREYENVNEKNIDLVSGTFGKIMAIIFTPKEDEWQELLGKVGFYLGKFIYIMDAYDDVEKDIKNKSYNPFSDIYMEKNFDEYVQNILLMMMASCTKEFEYLPIEIDVSILRNILYSGVWCRYETILKKRKEKESDARSI